MAMHRSDFLVIGSGIAGLSFALKVAKHGSVAVVTKRQGIDSNTAWAQGGVACITAEDDSVDSHVEDTLDAGAGLCDADVVRTIISEGPERIQELVDYGVEFDHHDVDGQSVISLGREGGHSKRRILHSRDTTGREIEEKLLAAAEAEPNITFYEHHYAIDLITTSKLGLVSDNRCVGIYALDEKAEEVVTFRSDRVILATGGCGKVYLYTSNPDVATGDGVAMAWRAGAVISNMEFIQFHPTVLYHAKAKSFLISEALRGEGGVLLGSDGEAFMAKYDERKDLAPRDIVARAIDQEMKRTGSRCVFLDMRHHTKEFLVDRFPHIYQTCMDHSVDPAIEPIPVVPAAHYQCGGVRTNIDGATSLKGLYAIGEVACTGLHGANRLASNSLLEGAVLAHRAVNHIVERLPLERSDKDVLIPGWQSGKAEDVDELVVIYHNWDEIRHLMWDYVSIVRTDKRLQRAATRLQNLKHEVHEFYWNFKISADLLELRNLVDVAAVIVESARLRQESIGLHYTLDHPDKAADSKDSRLTRF
ncbi:MAG: L-aspartate oxidase [Verrucomicrobiales bacterium]|jgi:L-aspartate oxidase